MQIFRGFSTPPLDPLIPATPERCSISLVISHWEPLKCISSTEANIQQQSFKSLKATGGLALGKQAAFSEKKYSSCGFLHDHGLSRYGDVYCFPLSQIFKCSLL